MTVAHLRKLTAIWLSLVLIAAPAIADVTPAGQAPAQTAQTGAVPAAPAAQTQPDARTLLGDTPLPGEQPLDQPRLDDQSLLDDLSARTFRFFWETANPKNGLIPDRYPTPSFSSIAAVGFALTVYPIGVERGYITREQARVRTLNTLRFFHNGPQGPQPRGVIGHKGFFYHFLNMETGMRWATTELSTVDTALLIGGVLFAQSYFTGDDPREIEIRDLAEKIFARVDWQWAQANAPGIALAWRPERGFSAHDWSGYNEAMIVYLLGLGSPTHALLPESWDAWTDRYDEVWGSYYQQEYLMFSPGFGHQYSHIWVDFRDIQDEYMRARGLDYFENSRRAAFAQAAYAEANPLGWQGYGAGVWGLTASDGPGRALLSYQGEERQFRGYAARGIGYPTSHSGLGESYDDGTIAPTAAASSIVFTPQLSIQGIREMRARYGKYIYSEYGFLDSFNPSFTFEVELHRGKVIPGFGWVADDYLGIDQGPIILMIENYRTGFVWEVMRENAHIRRGLQRGGFSGGWLQETAPTELPSIEEELMPTRIPAFEQELAPERTPSIEQELTPERTPSIEPELSPKRTPSIESSSIEPGLTPEQIP
ncbi:MAG: glucoamylase family protein [Woeseia sp.]